MNQRCDVIMAERIQYFVVDMFYTATVKQSSKTIVKLFNRLNFIVIFRFIAIAKANNVYVFIIERQIMLTTKFFLLLIKIVQQLNQIRR